MKTKIISALTIVFIILLPYYLFNGKLFVGGDDTRLLYSYPYEYLKNVTFFTWYNVSSIGINTSNQYLLPFLTLLVIVHHFISSKVTLSYLAFSFPLVMGFLYFQKAIKELFALKKGDDLPVFLGSLFFIFSPILTINQLFISLTTVFLIGLIPFVIYYFLRYIKTGNFSYVYISSIVCLIFSTALISIPWILGLFLPLSAGLIAGSVFYKRKHILNFVKRGIIFFGFILLTQAFWLTPFVSAYFLPDGNSFAQKIVSKGFVDTFSPTVLSTATGNVLYPLLNLFHRQIPIDFGWSLKLIFINFFDKIFIFNSVYILILTIGLIKFKNTLLQRQRKIFIIIFISFVVSLFLFTVNIGFLKDIFLLLRFVPGFVMFRNFFDKFAPGYIILYSVIITVSLVIVGRVYRRISTFLFLSFFVVVLLNALPIKNTIDAPLWGTTDIYRTMIFPEEYMKTMNYISRNISSTNTILSVPFGTSIYSVVKDQTSNNIYVGVSPVKIFSGVNDVSGHLSFNFSDEANEVDGLIINRKYDEFSKMLFNHNINYVLLTKNIPKNVFNTWVFDENMVKNQDEEFLNSIVKKEEYKSKDGNYILFSLNKRNTLISGSELEFLRINPTKYRLKIMNLKKNRKIQFNDSFNSGWKLFLEKGFKNMKCEQVYHQKEKDVSECKENFSLYEGQEILYLFKKPIFENSHSLLNNISNEWTIDPSYIKQNYDASYYTVNKDGSINIDMVLYFVPQSFFYIGVIISFAVFMAGGFFIIYEKKNKKI